MTKRQLEMSKSQKIAFIITQLFNIIGILIGLAIENKTLVQICLILFVGLNICWIISKLVEWEVGREKSK